jgi:hypothetical protein
VEGRVKHPAFGLVDYAKGDVFRRNNVVALKDALNARSNGGAVNSYITAYRFPEAYRDHCRTTGSVSDYAGPAYADFLHWDVDCKGNLHAALLAARGLVTYVQDRFDVRPDQLRYFFSGAKGVHILLPTALLGEVEPSPLIPAVWKSMALAIAAAADVNVDKVVYDVNRLFRLPDTQHKESRLWKVELTWEELFHLGTEEIRAIATAPRGNLFRPHDLEPIDALVEFYAKHAEAAEVEAARPRTGCHCAVAPVAPRSWQVRSQVRTSMARSTTLHWRSPATQQNGTSHARRRMESLTRCLNHMTTPKTCRKPLTIRTTGLGRGSR